MVAVFVWISLRRRHGATSGAPLDEHDPQRCVGEVGGKPSDSADVKVVIEGRAYDHDVSIDYLDRVDATWGFAGRERRLRPLRVDPPLRGGGVPLVRDPDREADAGPRDHASR